MNEVSNPLLIRGRTLYFVSTPEGVQKLLTLAQVRLLFDRANAANIVSAFRVGMVTPCDKLQILEIISSSDARLMSTASAAEALANFEEDNSCPRLFLATIHSVGSLEGAYRLLASSDSSEAEIIRAAVSSENLHGTARRLYSMIREERDFISSLFSALSYPILTTILAFAALLLTQLLFSGADFYLMLLRKILLFSSLLFLLQPQTFRKLFKSLWFIKIVRDLGKDLHTATIVKASADSGATISQAMISAAASNRNYGKDDFLRYIAFCSKLSEPAEAVKLLFRNKKLSEKLSQRLKLAKNRDAAKRAFSFALAEARRQAESSRRKIRALATVFAVISSTVVAGGVAIVSQQQVSKIGVKLETELGSEVQ